MNIGIVKIQNIYSLYAERIVSFHCSSRYNLRWPVIMDMMSTYSSFQLEACLIRFYTITRNVLLLRRQQGQTLTPEEEFLLSFTYFYTISLISRMDANSRKRGRSSTDRSFLISGVCHDKEKVLYDKIRDIDHELNKICNVFFTF